MLDPAISDLAVIGMVTIAVGGVAYVFLYPLLSGERRREKRLKSVGSSVPRTAQRLEQTHAREQKNRSRKVQDTLKDLEAKSKSGNSKPSLKMRLSQAGLKMTPRGFYVMSLVIAVVAGGLSFLASGIPLVGLAMAFAAGFGLPRWIVGFLIRRRQRKFIAELPNAIDIIVRGVKAGLPFADCLRIIASESQEPLKSEFRDVIESQAIGVQAGEAIERMYKRIPLAEVNFFAITVGIQQSSGGNLSEALGNLGKVLRERKKMAAKIKAVSQEAKASAAIIGALPGCVMMIVYLTSPDYIELLWTERLGQIMLAACGIWMLIGVLVMRKMINFDF